MWAWVEIHTIEVPSRTIYKPPFLLYVVPCCFAIVAASQWPRELRLFKSCLNTGVAQVREGQFTGFAVHRFAHPSQVTSGSLGAVEVTATDIGISLWVWDDGTNTNFGLPPHHWHFYPQPDTENFWLLAFWNLHFPIDLQPSLWLSVYVRMWIQCSFELIFNKNTQFKAQLTVKQKIKTNKKSKQKSCIVCWSKIKKLLVTWTSDGSAPGGQKACENFLAN